MSRLIVIAGPTGAGKTTLAYRLRQEVPALAKALILDEDETRRRLLGYDLRTEMQDPDYEPDVTARVRKEMDAQARVALSQGQSVIDCSGFWFPASRAAIHALARESGADFIGLWLEVPRAELEARIDKRQWERATLSTLSVEQGHASDADKAVLDKYADFRPPTLKEGWLLVNGSGKIEIVFHRILSIISMC
ncbi:MAG: AAA family ATPase [Bdellovibrionales bacterium]